MTKNNIANKICVVCQRLLTWRKKWKKVWQMLNIVQLNVEETEIKLMAHPPGFEPGTSASAGLRSIH